MKSDVEPTALLRPAPTRTMTANAATTAARRAMQTAERSDILSPAPISRSQYQKMIAAGVFAESDKLELLDGVIVAMTLQGTRHCAAIFNLTELLFAACAGKARVGCQLPFAAGDASLPEPDLYVVAQGVGQHEFPDRALLVVEVAETSLLRDRNVKAPRYAAAGVPEYWIVDVVKQLVEVYTQPLDDRYAQGRVACKGERLQLVALPGSFVDVSQIFPD